MKHLIIFPALVLLNLTVHAQKMPSDYFEEGAKAAEDSNYTKAISCFKYIVEHHPHNELYSKAFFNVGYLYHAQNYDDSAEMVFRGILNGNFNEREALGGDIMSDPYANFKHRSAFLLHVIFKKRQQYDSAVRYLVMADTVYPYLHFCGNELAENTIYMALCYGDLYNKMGKHKKAERSLLRVAFPNGLAGNGQAIDSLKALMSKDDDKEEIKQQLSYAINNYFIDTSYYDSGKDTSYSYCIYFMKTKMDIGYREPRYSADDKPDTRSLHEKVVAYIKETPFYQMVEDL
jgi:tetratricopeptide (TPR) repeat protein